MLLFNAEMTNYPKIYSNSHWGLLPYNSKEVEIVNNRNNFVNDHDITKYWERNDNLDLPNKEVYRSSLNKVIVIYSTFDNHYTFNQKYGFIQINKLFSNDAKTYCKTFHGLVDLNRFVSRIAD